MSRRPALLRAALLALVAGAAPAAAAAPPLDVDLPPDHDEEAEQKSGFWEKALAPAGQKYGELVEKAVVQLGQKDKAARELAASLLRDAVKIAPDRPLAHFWLGRVAAESGDPAACAREIARALDLDPGFVPPALSAEIPPEWTGPYELAVCRAQAGEYEAAIDGLRRILAGGVETEGDRTAVVHWRLGEAYMALGRLDEALAALQQASRLRPYDVNVTFALAVAFDRAEDAASARDAMQRALEREPRVSTGSLLAANRIWIPLEDQHYYLGLAYLGAGEAARALFHLRRYLAATGEGSWTARARAHLETAQAGAIAGRDLTVRGTASLDQARSAAAVGKHDGELQACVGKSPDLLLSVTLTRVVPGGEPRGEPARPGVRVLVLEQGSLKSEAVRAATECVEGAAGKISLPRATGPAGGYATAAFSLIAR